MTECQHCDSAVNDAYLCSRCRDELHTELAELPWWLDRLTETALGQTRMSDNGGRKSAPRKDLDGDRELAACIEQLPAGDDLEMARNGRQKAALAHALATGGVNARASELLAEIASGLVYWCLVLCETNGINYEPLPSRRSLGANHAHWLASNIDLIASSQDAGDIAADILGRDKRRRGITDQIVQVINRPIRMVYLGNCQTWMDDDMSACGFTLRAPEDSVEVYCPGCKRTHNCHRLLLELVDRAEREVVTFDELSRTNRLMHAEYRVATRTLQHWRASGLLRARQWVRPDGRRGLTQHGPDDVPLYSWADVKRLQLRKPQKAVTGAAARQKCQTVGE